MESNNSECHFYSCTNKNTTEYISYNPENNHEKEMSGTWLLNRIKDLVDILNNKKKTIFIWYSNN